MFTVDEIVQEAVAMLPAEARVQKDVPAYNQVWRIVNAAVLAHIAANGSATVIRLGYLKRGDVVSCEVDGERIRMTGARFRTWITRELCAGMEVSAVEGETSAWGDR